MSEVFGKMNLPSSELSVHSRPVVILVSPSGDRNVGGVARAMGNFGLSELRLVEPRCDYLNLESKRMSMQSFEILQNAKVFSHLKEALSDLEMAIAFSGKSAEVRRPQENLFSFMSKWVDRFHPKAKMAFVFGREEWGLRLDELDLCNWQVDIPTSEERPSMNLACAVSVVLAVSSNAISKATNKRSYQKDIVLAPKAVENAFFERVFQLLCRTRFVNPENREQQMSDLRALYHRSGADYRDLRILFGILAALEQSCTTPRL